MRNSMRLLALAVLVMVLLDQALSINCKSQTKDKYGKAKLKRADTTEGRVTKLNYKSTGQHQKSKNARATSLPAQAAQDSEEPFVNESDDQKLYRKAKNVKRSASLDEMVQDPKIGGKLNKKLKSQRGNIQDIKVKDDATRRQQGSKVYRSRSESPSSSPIETERVRRHSQVVEMEEREEPKIKKIQLGSSSSLHVPTRRRRQSQVMEVDDVEEQQEEEEPVFNEGIQPRWCEPMVQEDEEESFEEQEPEQSAMQRYLVEEHIPGEEEEEEQDLVDGPLRDQPILERCYYKL